MENIGDVVQSILVHENFLFVAINGSSEIKRYVISQSGLKMPGITISTNNSGPREMVILNNRLYFTNWISKDIKILNLTTYVIESKIKLDGLPEDIITDGNYLYTSIPHISLYDQGNGTNVIKIDPSNNTIIDSFDVGRGPQHLLINGENLFISRTYYSDDWYQVFFAATKVNLIDNDIIKTEYQSGIVCGGSIMKIEDMVYRTYNGGVAQIDENSLNIRSSSRIGDYPISSLYSAASLEQHLYFGITNDYEFPDTVFIHNISNSDIKFYEVGASPGDYSIWIED